MNNSENSSNDRQNVSFKFSKVASKALTGNRLDENTQKSTDFVTSVEEREVKTIIQREKVKDLVIPLIKKNKWRSENATNSLSEEEMKIKNLAVEELLKETSEKNAQWENREFTNYAITIPLIMQNKIPAGYETEERMDVSLRAEESKLEDYDKVPVEKYGLAMLRGMGWKEGDGIGSGKESVEPVQVQLRPKGLGLGADTSALKKAQSKNSKDAEKLELVKGAYVNILQGSHKGFYGQVMGLDEENGRAIVKLSGAEDKVVTFPEFHVIPVSKKEFDKESKIINRASYENYKREAERKEKDVSRKENERKERSKDSSRDEKRRYREDSEERSSKKSESSKKRRHSKERREEEITNSDTKRNKIWVRPQLRVRFIDEKYKKGRYFNKKVVVMDVLSSKVCSCKTEDNKYLDDVSPSMLETVIPRDESAYVMIVQGKYAGELCTILKKDKTKCLATVQFLSDRSHALKIEYDSICEYVGDISQFD